MAPTTRDVAVLHFFSSAGDEGQAALAVVQASQKDCGVYRCVISNEYGTDSTDFLFSPEGEEPSATSHSFLGVPWGGVASCRKGLVPGCSGGALTRSVTPPLWGASASVCQLIATILPAIPICASAWGKVGSWQDGILAGP